MTASSKEKSESISRAISNASEDVVGEMHDTKPKVHFGVLSALGVQFSITAAPIALGTYLSLTIGVGGPPAYFWTFILVGVMQFICALAVSELASAIPHSSGPAHWVVILGPAKYRRGLGYIMGWLLTGAWICIVCSSCLYPAQLTLALVKANIPEYGLASYHVYLVYLAYLALFLVVNMPVAFKSLGPTLSAAIFFFNGSALYILITLLVRTKTKQTAEVVFIDFVNDTGWSSDGWVFFVGILPAIAVLSIFDSVTHLTDELETPTKQVPIVLLGSLSLSFFVGIPMILVYQFCNIDPSSLLDPVGGQPLIQLMLNATSLPLTNIGISLVIFCFAVSGASALLTCSRMYWSFSREGALPFSSTMSKLSSRDSIPLNAILWVSLLAMGLGTVSIGSSTAMNALFGATGLCSGTTLIVAMALALWNGRGCLNKDRWLNTGRWGVPIFVVSFLWTVFVCICLSMPLYLPVTPATMNWASVVFAGILVLSGIYWVLFYTRSPRYRSAGAALYA